MKAHSEVPEHSKDSVNTTSYHHHGIQSSKEAYKLRRLCMISLLKMRKLKFRNVKQYPLATR